LPLATNITNLTTRVATEFKLLKTMISGSGTGNVSGLATTATNLVGAINEVRTTANSAAALIDDGAASATRVWSSTKTNTEITTAVSSLVNAAPGALDQLNELAAAIGNDANFATTLATSMALKAPLASPALTGAPTAPTATAGNNSTQLATTAYTDAAASVIVTGLGADYATHDFVADFNAALV
jgi:hypothetical protein